MRMFLASFAYGGVYPETHDCLMAELGYSLIHSQQDKNFSFKYATFYGSADIAKMRALAVERVLKEECDVLVMVDHDMVWSAKDGVLRKMAQMALETFLDPIIVGLACPKKALHGPIASRVKSDIDLSKEDSYGKLYEAEYIGGALTAYPVQIIKEVVEKSRQTLNGFNSCFLPLVREDGLYLSEDWAFCERASWLGYKSYILLEKGIRHIGNYKYNLGGKDAST